MKDVKTIFEILKEHEIYVPSYQRAYSWDTQIDTVNTPKQVDTFLADLEEYKNSNVQSKYYFGHFLFEEKSENKFGVIDGQQRLTTITIFLVSLFKSLKQKRELTKDEIELYEQVIKNKKGYHFTTVEYDALFLNDCIDGRLSFSDTFKTISAKRIYQAFTFFENKLSDKDDIYIKQMLDIVLNASCTNHVVLNESEAIQMFVFQNNRGKKPSKLEIIKAQLMFNIHLYAGDEKENLLNEIKQRFEEIYKSIAKIEHKINEDEVLSYTLQTYYNSLWETDAIAKVNEELSNKNNYKYIIEFISKFTSKLQNIFEIISKFYSEEFRNIQIHSLITLGGIGIAFPFIIKAYLFNLSVEDKNTLFKSLESIILRHRLIGTRADLKSRLNDSYQNFTDENKSIAPIIERIKEMKECEDNYWLGHWQDDYFEEALTNELSHSVAKYLLWKYENYLRENEGKSGYKSIRFTDIENPELEHIAPQTKPSTPNSGYTRYTQNFLDNYLNCLGNYLLISKSHNCSVGNIPFKEKRDSYNELAQQRKIQEMTDKNNPQWTIKLIQERQEEIIEFILNEF